MRCGFQKYLGVPLLKVKIKEIYKDRQAARNIAAET